MLISLKNYTNTPNTWDFCHKNHNYSVFHAEYTENSEYSMRFFQKIGKLTGLEQKLTIKPNNLSRKLRKVGFFTKISTNFRKPFLQIITCGYILAKLLKQLSFPHKQRWKPFTSNFSAKPSTIIVENTENSPNSSSYTIEYKLVRNSHLLSQKLAFYQVSQKLCTYKVQIAHTQITKKQQLTAHASIVKRYTAKCYKHTPFLFKSALVWSLALANQLTISTQNAKQTNITHIVITL